MKLVDHKSGNRVEWVLEMTEAERAAADSRSLDCARPFAIANNSASLGMTTGRQMPGMTNYGGTPGTTDPRAIDELCTYNSVIGPWMTAVADPREKWWLGMRKNPKRSGEISQAAFLFRARTMGLKVALPWGDSERYDFVVWAEEGGPMFRVQVKGTGRLYRRGYEGAARACDAEAVEEEVYGEGDRCGGGACAAGGCVVPAADCGGGAGEELAILSGH